MDAKVVIGNDTHYPYQDSTAVNLFLGFINREKPDIVILNGDIIDFYSISRFSKDPNRKTPDYFKKEIAATVAFLRRVRAAAGNKRVIYIEGNHEARLKKYLWANESVFSDLDEIGLPRLLKLDENIIEYRTSVKLGDLFVYHGSCVRKDSGATAKAEYQANGCTGISGHCFSADTEILTLQGWATYDKLKLGDSVGTRNKTTGRFEWNAINDIFEYDNFQEMYHIKSTIVDLLVTNGHGLLVRNYAHKQMELTAEQLLASKGRHYFLCGAEPSGYVTIDPIELSLLVNIITDGSVEDGAIRWHLKKERKIKHLKNILQKLNIPLSECKQKNGNTKIRISAKYAWEYMHKLNHKKVVPIWFKLLNKECVDIILKEYSITDGCKNKSAQNSYQISSAKEFEIDILQEMFVTNGYRATKCQHKTTWVLTVNTNQETVIEKQNISVELYSGKVWCVNVDNGTLIVRRNGKVVTTLNCHRDGKFGLRNRGGLWGWWENYCLCDLNPEYMEGIANWVQGFSCVHIINNHPHVDQIAITGRKYVWGGKIYR